MSVDDYLVLPDDGVRYELIDGVVVMSPSPANSHQHVALEIATQLRNFVMAANLGVVLIEADVVLSTTAGGRGTVYRPEMHFVRRERAINLAERTRIVPDVVLEVISPDSRGRDQTTKLRDYEAAGVGEYWLIDPIEDRVYFFRLRDGKFFEVASGSRYYQSEVVPGFQLDLDKVRASFRALG